MTRREARENAVGLLFEFGFRPDADAASIYDAAAEVREMPEDEFEKGLFLGTVENLDAIDAAIARKCARLEDGQTFKRRSVPC